MVPLTMAIGKMPLRSRSTAGGIGFGHPGLHEQARGCIGRRAVTLGVVGHVKTQAGMERSAMTEYRLNDFRFVKTPPVDTHTFPATLPPLR